MPFDPNQPPILKTPAATSPLTLRTRRTLLALATLLLLALAALAIYAAFLGSQRASQFFNSLPLTAFWTALAALLLLGFAIFPRLLRQPGLLAMHLGATLILLGAMWGSDRAHQWRKQFLKSDKIPHASLIILQGQTENLLLDPQDPNLPLATLPFSLALNEFWIDYHWSPATLHLRHTDGRTWSLPAQPGRSLDLPDNLPTITVQRLFHSLTVRDTPIDAPRGRPNPAAFVHLHYPTGQAATAYVFPHASPHAKPDPNLAIILHLQPQAPSNFFAELVILDPQRHNQFPFLLEVNRPLHYGGYRFFQSDYGYLDNGRPYTILTVTSDSGQTLIYAALAAHLLAFLLALLRLSRSANTTYACGFLIVLAAWLLRWATAGHVPLQSMFEIFLVLAMIYPLTRFCRRFLQTGLEPFDMLLAAIVLFPAGFIFPDHPQHLPPALQSHLFIPHVAAYMIAYILLAKAAAQAAARLLKPAPHDLHLVSYEIATYRLTAFAFPLLTLGLILGAVWGNRAWGDYWGWDPKELWSLATWALYLAYLHTRTRYAARHPRLNSLLNLTAFAAVLITLLWVNLSNLFPGLHSYA